MPPPLHLSLPVVKEHVRDIAVSRYRGTDYGQKCSETTFDKDCTIRFDWK